MPLPPCLFQVCLCLGVPEIQIKKPTQRRAIESASAWVGPDPVVNPGTARSFGTSARGRRQGHRSDSARTQYASLGRRQCLGAFRRAALSCSEGRNLAFLAAGSRWAAFIARTARARDACHFAVAFLQQVCVAQAARAMGAGCGPKKNSASVC